MDAESPKSTISMICVFFWNIDSLSIEATERETGIW